MKIEKRKIHVVDILFRYGTVIAIVALIAFFSVKRPHFFSYENMADIFRSISIVTLIALGLTFSLSVNGLDISVASMAGMSNILAAGMMVYHDQGLVVAILVPVLIGVVVGLLNAFMIVVVHLPDLLATLSMLYVIRGAMLTYCGGYSIYSNMLRLDGTQAPGKILDSFIFLGQGYLGPVPMPVIIMILLVISVHVFFTYTRYGRFLYATGGNIEAARLSGIPVAHYRINAYVLSGVFAALGGIILAARLGSGQVDAGSPFLLDAAAAAYIGFSVFGIGKPNALGTFLGAMLLGILVNGMTMMNVPFYSQDIVKGLVLASALAITYYRKKR